MVGRLLLRASVGGLFIGHGAQKLLGAFEGDGLAKTAELFEMTGLKPGLPYAVAAGVAETAGGAGILLGQQTPLAAAAAIGSMGTAIDRIHFKNGIWEQHGGYEYPIVLIAAAATIAELGPGKLSLDARKGRKRSGDIWALLALGIGLGGAAGLRYLVDFTNAKPAADDPFAGTPVASTPADATVDAAPEAYAMPAATATEDVPVAPAPYSSSSDSAPAYSAPAAAEPYSPPATSSDPYASAATTSDPYSAPVTTTDPYAAPATTSDPYAASDSNTAAGSWDPTADSSTDVDLGSSTEPTAPTDAVSAEDRPAFDPQRPSWDQ